jgi:hypothetical protein
MQRNAEFHEGVFPDSACFLDRVRVSLVEKVRPKPWVLLTESSNKSCGGLGSYHGRCSNGRFDLTGNPFCLNYGKFTRLPRVPEALLYLDSERSPLTVAEVCLAVSSLTGESPKVTYAELTWDLRGNFEDISRGIVSRITRHRLLLVDPKTGRRTLYLGTRKSERQVCLYDKVPGIVRLEIRLRSRGLRRLGVTRPDQLLLLRTVDFSRLVSICELRVPAVVGENWRRKLWQYFAERQPVDTLMREFTQHYRVQRDELLRPTPLDTYLRDTQRKLIC